jgi:hypothetical protein
LIQYNSHQPHFGPHDIQISVFDPRTSTDREIYPFTPCDAVRANFVRRYRESRGEVSRPGLDSCWAEAEQLTPSHFDWATNTFAFALDLFYQYPEVGPWDQRVQVMVTCEGLTSVDSIKCRETPLEAWQTARPDLNLTQLVTFAASRPRIR